MVSSRSTPGLRRRGINGLLFLPLMLLIISFSSRAQDIALSEYELKAGFLFNFAKFVDWPADSFAEPKSPFVIGIIGQNPFDDALMGSLTNKAINGHPFAVKQLKSAADTKNCHILFISESERRRLSEILRSARDGHALTVSEIDRFLTAGGMIQFLKEGNKVRFAINDAAAREAGLRISSKLLNLARHKTPERQP